jgi:hypothetical protein
MLSRRWIFLLLSGLVASYPARLAAETQPSQQALTLAQPVALATVTDRLVFADMQQPARAAYVTLIPAAAGEAVFDRG